MRTLRLLALPLLCLLFSLPALAQPKAIGARLGYGVELSYQHSLGKNFLEADLGLFGFGNGLSLAVVHDWVLATPAVESGKFEFFMGLGGGLQVAFYRGTYVNTAYGTVGTSGGVGLGLGLAGQIGIQYTFSFPLQIGLDWRPIFGPVIVTGPNGGVGFHLEGLYGGGLSLRYAF